MAVIDSKPSDSEARTALCALCQRVRKAGLRVDDLASLIPRGSLHPFLQEVAGDLADAVEHTPYKWFSSDVNVEAWQRSEEYLTVYLDERLLGSGALLEDLAKVREQVLARPTLSKAVIDDAVRIGL